jgi:hypothetical protein
VQSRRRVVPKGDDDESDHQGATSETPSNDSGFPASSFNHGSKSAQGGSTLTVQSSRGTVSIHSEKNADVGVPATLAHASKNLEEEEQDLRRFMQSRRRIVNSAQDQFDEDNDSGDARCDADGLKADDGVDSTMDGRSDGTITPTAEEVEDIDSLLSRIWPGMPSITRLDISDRPEQDLSATNSSRKTANPTRGSFDNSRRMNNTSTSASNPNLAIPSSCSSIPGLDRALEGLVEDVVLRGLKPLYHCMRTRYAVAEGARANANNQSAER